MEDEIIINTSIRNTRLIHAHAKFRSQAWILLSSTKKKKKEHATETDDKTRKTKKNTVNEK